MRNTTELMLPPVLLEQPSTGDWCGWMNILDPDSSRGGLLELPNYTESEFPMVVICLLTYLDWLPALSSLPSLHVFLGSPPIRAIYIQTFVSESASRGIQHLYL